MEIWEKPQMNEVAFAANEYVTVCYTAESVLTNDGLRPYVMFSPGTSIYIGDDFDSIQNDPDYDFYENMYNGDWVHVGGSDYDPSVDEFRGDTEHNSGKWAEVRYYREDGLYQTFQSNLGSLYVFLSESGKVYFSATPFQPANEGYWS